VSRDEFFLLLNWKSDNDFDFLLYFAFFGGGGENDNLEIE